MSRNGLHENTPFVIRPARAEDKETILTFCERTYEWGDYVPEVLDEWLDDECGQVLVATLDDVPVGVAYVALLTPTEAWLQGLRVHPEHRRMGLAEQFLCRCLELARQWGAHVARLATSSRNVAVHKVTERAGMRHAATVWVLEAPVTVDPDGGPVLIPLTQRHWPLLEAYFRISSTLADMSGLYGLWDMQALTDSKLRDHLERGQVFGLWEGDHLVATAIILEVDERWSCLSVAYADSLHSHGQTLAHALRNHASDLGLDTVEVVVPSAGSIHHALLRAGFEPGAESEHDIWIYELAWEATAS
jgi:GNAT superfamily N-acetyltransferase